MKLRQSRLARHLEQLYCLKPEWTSLIELNNLQKIKKYKIRYNPHCGLKSNHVIVSEALSPAFIHAGADLWPHPLNFANAEQLQQLQQQALLHPALQHQLPVRSFL